MPITLNEIIRYCDFVIEPYDDGKYRVFDKQLDRYVLDMGDEDASFETKEEIINRLERYIDDGLFWNV